jgi:hypothetical protein
VGRYRAGGIDIAEIPAVHGGPPKRDHDAGHADQHGERARHVNEQPQGVHGCHSSQGADGALSTWVNSHPACPVPADRSQRTPHPGEALHDPGWSCDDPTSRVNTDMRMFSPQRADG